MYGFFFTMYVRTTSDIKYNVLKAMLSATVEKNQMFHHNVKVSVE